ncbi:MAG: nitric-oxide reductase [Clostridia bacterium]|nr:MAG: nitric-oxide reductase [Clostridia bacterium]
MLRYLFAKLFSRLFHRQGEPTPGRPREYPSQGVAYPYALAAFLFFGIQSLVATAGALDQVIPDLPVPVPFEVGRSIHLNLAIFWPLLGAMGLAYYFFVAEAGTDLASRRLARGQFLIFTLILLLDLGALSLKLTEGREYLEAIPPLDWALVLASVIFAYNLGRTYLKHGVPRGRPTLLAFLLGAITLVAFFVPNLFFYPHPAADEIVKFWVVHLWEEGSLELVATAVLAAVLLAVLGEGRAAIEGALWLELFLVVASSILSTAHHYYWIGLPSYWMWIGGVFSGLQLVPILLLTFSAAKGFRRGRWRRLDPASKLSLAMVASSVFYHLTGAGLLGFTLAIPRLNLYAHGTYLTSAHAHLALFGAFGLMILAGSFYVLTRHLELSRAEGRRAWLGLALVNLGLVVMGGALALAGFLQAYLWRVVGGDFMEVQGLIRPYLGLRAAGGAFFAVGDLLLVWAILAPAWRQRHLFLRELAFWRA